VQGRQGHGGEGGALRRGLIGNTGAHLRGGDEDAGGLPPEEDHAEELIARGDAGDVGWGEDGRGSSQDVARRRKADTGAPHSPPTCSTTPATSNPGTIGYSTYFFAQGATENVKRQGNCGLLVEGRRGSSP